MKTIRVYFLSENFQFLEVKFSIYLNRRVFVMVKMEPRLRFFFLCFISKDYIFFISFMDCMFFSAEKNR